MSIVIEQDEKEFRAASGFLTRAELDRVTLIDATMKKGPNLSSLTRPFKIDVQFEPGLAALSERCANLQIHFQFRAIDSSAAETEVITLGCTLEASYSLHEGYKPEPVEVDAFHKANAVFNSWPFFREFVQSSVLRMNMPAPPVPFLRLAARPKEEQSTPSLAEPTGPPASSGRRSRAKRPRTKVLGKK
jgi:hypothetical protein